MDSTAEKPQSPPPKSPSPTPKRSRLDPPADPPEHARSHSLSSFLQSSPSPDPPVLPSDPPPTLNLAHQIQPDSEKGSRVVSSILLKRKRTQHLQRASLLCRIAAMVFSLVSFAVMAADRTKGWAGDSFDRYIEYRFCISVNVLAFVYSAFQTYARVHVLVFGKNIIPLPTKLYFDLSMDQIFAYLLIAAGSSASARNNDWITNWGNDPFTMMANGSISVAFLAFAAFACCALISAFNLFGKNM